MGGTDPEMAYRDPEFQIPEEKSNSLLGNTRCCFCFPCFGSRASSSAVGLAWWERIRYSSAAQGSHATEDHHSWWQRGIIEPIKKLREWSEIVAGPKWKTFIRRFNRNHRGSGNARHGKFQYDALSYSLNFDEGQNGVFEGDDDYSSGFRNFSSRYASVPGSGRPLNMDVVDKDVAVNA